jgi:hypothetical protein
MMIYGVIENPSKIIETFHLSLPSDFYSTTLRCLLFHKQCRLF